MRARVVADEHVARESRLADAGDLRQGRWRRCQKRAGPSAAIRAIGSVVADGVLRAVAAVVAIAVRVVVAAVVAVLGNRWERWRCDRPMTAILAVGAVRTDCPGGAVAAVLRRSNRCMALIGEGSERREQSGLTSATA